MADIRPTTVTDITKELMAQNIIKELGSGRKNTAQNKKSLMMNPDFRNVVGMDIFQGRLSRSLTDFSGSILCEVQEKLEQSVSLQEFSDKLIEIFYKVLEFATAEILNIGIAFDGLIDKNKNVVAMSSRYEQIKGYDLCGRSNEKPASRPFWRTARSQ
jgi:hypothetical protein